MKLICGISGGLGNQMFQYAYGRALAERTGGRLLLDLSWFEESHTTVANRAFGLDLFCLDYDVALKEDIVKLKGSGKRKKGLSRFFSFDDSNFIQESFYHFDKSMLQIKNDAYLAGYWQSEKYFSDFGNLIRSDFTFKDALNDDYNKLSLLMETQNSVAIHLRRGDYITDKKTSEYHGVCSLKYYDDAIKIIKGKVKDPVFYFFSDDLKWVKENLKVDVPCVYVESPHSKDFEDMLLMTKCRHFIIANSSFSWWGAWLSTNRDKTVIAPLKWFNDRSKDTSDLIPQGWTRI